jgi:hypothetical protein
MKMGKLVKLCMTVPVIAIVFGVYASSSYGQETSTTDDTMTHANPPSTPKYVNVGKGYKIGGQIILSSSTGNLGLGQFALSHNPSGSQNTAIGGESLMSNSTGNSNTAVGLGTLDFNNVGSSNIAIGLSALSSNEQGSFNIGIGIQAALNVNPAGSNNIHIGSLGSFDDSGVIRIGCSSSCDGGRQTASYIAGIAGVTLPTASEPLVCIDPPTGQLGTVNCAANGMIEALQRQNEELQQRVSRLEALIAKK